MTEIANSHGTNEKEINAQLEEKKVQIEQLTASLHERELSFQSLQVLNDVQFPLNEFDNNCFREPLLAIWTKWRNLKTRQLFCGVGRSNDGSFYSIRRTYY